MALPHRFPRRPPQLRMGRLPGLLSSLLLSLLLAGPGSAMTPAQASRTPVQPGSVAAGQLQLPDPASVLAVPPELQRLLQREVIEQARYPEQRLQRLVAFMFEPWGLGLSYDNGYTRTVAETWRDRRGNCLSFTMSFLALAELAGLDAHMQESDHALVSAPDSNTLLYTGHVNIAVRINRRTLEVDFDRERPLVRGFLRAASPQRVFGHYYNNRGAELMSIGEAALGRQHLLRAVEVDPAMVSAHNNLGVLYLRQQRHALAEQHLQQALQHDPRRIAALSNLVSLYRREQRTEDVEQWESRLQSAQDRNPYYHYVTGLRLRNDGEHEQALEHFRHAIRLDRRQPLYYHGMADSLQALGQQAQAERQRRKAAALDRREQIVRNQAISILRNVNGW